MLALHFSLFISLLKHDSNFTAESLVISTDSKLHWTFFHMSASYMLAGKTQLRRSRITVVQKDEANSSLCLKKEKMCPICTKPKPGNDNLSTIRMMLCPLKQR